MQSVIVCFLSFKHYQINIQHYKRVVVGVPFK